MEYNSKSLTREGATMLALADKEEKALIIDEVIVSEKVITAGNDISTLTMADFTSPLTYGISSKVQSDNQFSVKSVITNHWQDSANTDHTTNKDFNVALVGVVAHVDGYVDQHVLTVAVGNDPFVLPAYQGTDVSFVFGITQAYSASQNVTIKMDGSAYALATDLDDVKNLQGSIGIAIDDKLKDYAKKDEVQNLIPDDIATTKNLADGDAETLTSAKDYADTQASDKVKTTDTDNWQKAKISADDGSPKSFLYAKDNGNITMWIAGRPLGIHTFWCAAGVTGNPVSSSIQGTMSISSVKNGVGYCVSADGDFISITLVDGQVNYDILTKKSDIDPSVMVKTTLTATDDVLTLADGTYRVWQVTPKNLPAIGDGSGSDWGYVTIKSISAGTRWVEYTNIFRRRKINVYSGSPATWSGWYMPNEDSLALDANVVHRNPDTGVVSEPVDFTKLTVNGGKSVATSDDLKSLEDQAWRVLDNKYITAFSNDNTSIKVDDNSIFLVKIDEVNKRVYMFFTILGNFVKNSRIYIDLTSIVKNVSFPDYANYSLWAAGTSANVDASIVGNRICFKNEYADTKVLNSTHSNYMVNAMVDYSSCFVSYDELV